MKFAKRLRQLRKEKGLTQEELGNIFGLAKTTIAGYEKGGKEPKYEILVKIAEYFNVNTDYLLGLSDSKKRIVLKREEFEHLIPPEYKEQTRDLKWIELEDFCKEKDLTAENVRIIIETVLKQVK